jgi:hypothetical protein
MVKSFENVLCLPLKKSQMEEETKGEGDTLARELRHKHGYDFSAKRVHLPNLTDEQMREFIQHAYHLHKHIMEASPVTPSSTP